MCDLYNLVRIYFFKSRTSKSLDFTGFPACHSDLYDLYNQNSSLYIKKCVSVFILSITLFIEEGISKNGRTSRTFVHFH